MISAPAPVFLCDKSDLWPDRLLTESSLRSIQAFQYIYTAVDPQFGRVEDNIIIFQVFPVISRVCPEIACPLFVEMAPCRLCFFRRDAIIFYDPSFNFILILRMDKYFDNALLIFQSI